MLRVDCCTALGLALLFAGCTSERGVEGALVGVTSAIIADHARCEPARFELVSPPAEKQVVAPAPLGAGVGAPELSANGQTVHALALVPVAGALEGEARFSVTDAGEYHLYLSTPNLPVQLRHMTTQAPLAPICARYDAPGAQPWSASFPGAYAFSLQPGEYSLQLGPIPRAPAIAKLLLRRERESSFTAGALPQQCPTALVEQIALSSCASVAPPEITLNAAPLGASTPPRLEMDRFNGVRLRRVGSTNEGAVEFVPPHSGNFLIGLGTPRVPVRLLSAGVPRVAECGLETLSGPCAAIKSWVRVQLTAGVPLRVELGPISPQSWVRLFIVDGELDSDGDWIGRHGDTANTSFQPDAGPLTPENAANLRVHWRAMVGNATPRIVAFDGKLWLDRARVDPRTGVHQGVEASFDPVAAPSLTYSSGEGYVDRLLDESGRVVLTRQCADEVSCAFLSVGKHLFYSQQDALRQWPASYEPIDTATFGQLPALYAPWNVFSSQWGIGGPGNPVIADDFLYQQIFGVVEYDQEFCAQLEPGYPCSEYFERRESGLLAQSLDGQLRFYRRPMPKGTKDGLVVRANQIYFTSDAGTGLHAIDASTGSDLWSFGETTGLPAVSDSQVLFVSSAPGAPNEARLVSLNPSTGSVYFSVGLPPGVLVADSKPIVVNSVAALAAGTRLLTFDVTTGAALGSHDLGGTIGDIAAAYGYLYVAVSQTPASPSGLTQVVALAP